jgi:hypothetical protein
MLLAESLLGSSSLDPVYIEDVFSTYLYTGNGSTQTITNGIDLAGKGGLIWMKSRSATTNHFLNDTARSLAEYSYLSSNTTAAASILNPILYLNNGFTLPNQAGINTNAATYTSWTFRKQPKFFDVVTYTGNGANRTIAHSLGSVPGCIMVKRTDTTGDWQVYHRSLANTQYMVLNSTAAVATGATRWNSTTPTATVFSLGTDATVNANGGTYVAYLFAHDAGGFGATGADNVISCGTFTGNTTVNLGWEPQWILYKDTQAGVQWEIVDNMRGWAFSRLGSLFPNLSNAENSNSNSGLFIPTATGFQATSGFFNSPQIYIAIRRGPMRTPTSGTEVFGLNARTGTGADATVTGGQTADAALIKNRGSAVDSLFSSRLTGPGYLVTSSAAAEVSAGATILQANPWDVMDGVKVGTTSTITNASANTFINYLFRRAPGFFDVVCYTGDGVNGRSVSHNLTVQPELLIIKSRDLTNNWQVFRYTDLTTRIALSLNLTNAATGPLTNLQVSSTAFTVASATIMNGSGNTYVAYLFASAPGVSKVGSYTGTGATQVVNCGFAAGARFVMVKRTDSTGDWYVWDTARGIVAANDPYLLLNSTAAEVTNTDWVDTAASGFELSNAAGNNANISGASYIFLAIA